MLSLRFQIRGADVIQQQLQITVVRAPEACAGVLAPLGARYEAALIDAGPVGKGPTSGPRLHQRYERTVEIRAGTVRVRITNRAPYLGWVLRGRGPIVARPGKMLRFEILGTIFFRKRVGPAKANDFPRAARAQMAGELSALPGALQQAILQDGRA